MPKKKFFKKPGKKETLAEKQEARIQRLNHLRPHLPILPEWWVGIGEIGGIGGLLLINFWLLSPFFGQEDRVNVFSAPVIPLLAAFLERVIPYFYAVRIWLLVFLLLFPLVFYFFVREISGRRLTGFFAGLIASLPVGVFLTSRVKLGLLAEDGAQVASLTLTMLACFFLLKFVRQGGFTSMVIASLMITSVSLTSPLGLVVCLCFALAITFSEMLLGKGHLKLMRFLALLFLVIGFSAFWYNPKFTLLTINSVSGQLVKKTLANLLPVSFFLVPLLGTFGFLLFENRFHLQPLFLAVFWTIGFGVLSIGAGVPLSFPSRFLPAFGISLAFLMALILVWLFDFLRFSPRLGKKRMFFGGPRLVAFSFLSLFFGLMAILILLFRSHLRELAESRVLGVFDEIEKTGIWEIRGKVSAWEKTLGYWISGLTFLSTGFLRLVLRNEERKREKIAKRVVP